MSVSLHFFGAANCVTGSCTLLKTERASVLIDCGLFQGPKTLKALNYGAFPFAPASVQAVLLTHAHIDHSGLLPKLALAGFKRAIYATAGSLELCRVLLADAGAIQEMEVQALNRRNQRRGREPVEPIYTREDAERCLLLFRAVSLKTWVDVAPGVRARFWNAGHILGSSSIELEVTDAGKTQTFLFSGDIGPGGRDYAVDPEGPSGVDHLILESTYGDVERPAVTTAERKQGLAQEVAAAYAAGGPLLLPAFAVERTQELIVDLLDLMARNQAPPGPIFLDSPLAIEACNIFLRHGPVVDGEPPFAPLGEQTWLRFTESVSESRGIERWKGWHIIIAGSGMCDAGRVRHHLKRLLWRPEATVLLSGFQAVGTLGRLLQEGRQMLRIQGEEIKVRARVRKLDVYSGHADARALVAWTRARGPVRGGVYLNHGEPANLEGLRRRLMDEALAVRIAQIDEAYRVAPNEPGVAYEPATPRIPGSAPSQLDWHNARAAFSSALWNALDEAPDDAARERLLNDLSTRLEAHRRPSSPG